MLKRRDILASGMVLPAAAAAAVPRSATANPLVSTWSLIEATTVNAQGASGPWLGRKMSKGVIIYDVSGTVSVQISSARNSLSALTDFLSLPDDQRLAYLDSYYAYYGRYEYDAQSSIVTHFVEASLYPNEIGVALKRSVFLNGNEVTLTTPTSPNGARNVLRWRRIA